MDVLVLQLYGPMASWGTPAVGEQRPSSDHPGRSALIGLLAAALGIRRDDAPGQEALAYSVKFAVKQLTSGRIIRDFHTVQVPKRDRKALYATRKDEMAGSSDRLNTIISRREYRCDGLWHVAVTMTEHSDWTLEQLAEALRYPRFMLCLGRKSCPLAAPLSPRLVQAEGIKAALANAFPPIVDRQQRWFGMDGAIDYFWEDDAGDITAQDTRFPDDDVVSRERWQFRSRPEHHARLREE